MKLLFILIFTISVGYAEIPNNTIESFAHTRPEFLVILIPAKNYSMKGRIFEQLASRGKENGLSFLRFDWSFFGHNRNPSAELDLEAIELKEVIHHYQKKFKLKNERIILVAKSFGSRVLAKANLNSYPLALVTPNCDENASFKSTYSKLLQKKRPVQISISIEDPYCDISQIYRNLVNLPREVTMYTSYGDHNFVLNDTFQNQDVFVTQLLQWIVNVRNL